MLTNYTIDGFENVKYQGFGKLKFIENQLSNLFQRYGYCQVEIPSFENYEFYQDEQGINQDELFKLVNSSGKILALKPDATLPITRIAAINHHDPEEIIKFCYLTTIYKDFTSPEISKYETTQAGVEYFGNSDPSCDGEIVALAIESLKNLKVDDIHVDIGNVEFINSILDKLYLSQVNRDKLFKLIENKNIADLKEFLDSNTTISDEYKRVILELPQLYGKPEEVFTQMKELAITPKMESVLNYLKEVVTYLESLGFKDNINIDIGFTNRMSYYTGLIFKVYLPELGEPIVNGGRYDSLSRKFGIDRPACGFSIDMVSLLNYLEGQDLFENSEKTKNIIIYQPELRDKAFEMCNDIRSQGGSAEMFVSKGEFNNQVTRILKNAHYDNSNFYELNDEGLFQWKNNQKVKTSQSGLL